MNKSVLALMSLLVISLFLVGCTKSGAEGLAGEAVKVQKTGFPEKAKDVAETNAACKQASGCIFVKDLKDHDETLKDWYFQNAETINSLTLKVNGLASQVDDLKAQLKDKKSSLNCSTYEIKDPTWTTQTSANFCAGYFKYSVQALTIIRERNVPVYNFDKKDFTKMGFFATLIYSSGPEDYLKIDPLFKNDNYDTKQLITCCGLKEN